ncbi:pilus assembly protein PilO [Dolichospermum sp. FACHB-1091]|uniref:pilus assembly protein PilO n=1 Tax=Dolichospermum sp. FACHB-1091 TaxID=2692798 RepID=UPI00167FF076|nr:pilus assembly protein PilO [Dolichospermum sp. FACHB-1091]MBD2444718.1 pilus assembly protein PilO [Dolichospermum sp. FACHB-1091]
MTLSGGLNFAKEGKKAENSAPVVFGITLTPPIIGSVFAGLGVLGAFYMLVNMVMPAVESYKEQETKRDQLQIEIQQKQTQAKQIGKIKADLATAKEQQKQILALFADKKSLDTLLLDTSRLIDSSNTKVFGSSIQAKMKKFAPTSENAEVVTDSSFGAEINNKLKRTIIKVEIEGNFLQTQSIIRNIERLQPLLLVKNYESKLSPPEISTDKNNPVPINTGKLITSFELEALIPLTSEEEAALAPQPAAANTPKK